MCAVLQHLSRAVAAEWTFSLHYFGLAQPLVGDIPPLVPRSQGGWVVGATQDGTDPFGEVGQGLCENPTT